MRGLIATLVILWVGALQSSQKVTHVLGHPLVFFHYCPSLERARLAAGNKKGRPDTLGVGATFCLVVGMIVE